jgi:hypothetical protein
LSSRVVYASDLSTFSEGQRILLQTDETKKFDALPGGELAISHRLLDTFYAPEKK